MSVTLRRDVVYLVNAGDRTVTGFRRHGDGRLSALGVHQVLPGAGAAQIAFDRTGSRLIVTEKGTDTIDVLPVTDGVASAPVSTPSIGQTPFGFAIDPRNHPIVSKDAGGATAAITLANDRLTGATALSAVSSVVPDTQTAACWVVLSSDGRFTCTTNTGSGSISSYRLGHDGSLDLLQPVAASPGVGPIDMARRGRVLFTLNAGSHTGTTDQIGRHGQLTQGESATVPDSAVGLAVSAGDREDWEWVPGVGSMSQRSGNSSELFLETAMPHVDMPHTLARRLSPGREDAEDPVQDVMLRAFAVWRPDSPPRSMGAWLARICINTAASTGRRRRCRPIEANDDAAVLALEPGVAGRGTYLWTRVNTRG